MQEISVQRGKPRASKSRLVLLVVYHLHGQTGRFTVWANGKQISVLGNSVRDWCLPFAEIPTILCHLQKNLHNGEG